MKFLVDTHLPRRMVQWFNSAGCDAIHTLDLLVGNRSPDAQIIEIAERDQRIVVSKDADFVNSHVLSGRPPKLLLVSTGNISNRDLEKLVVPLIPSLVVEFRTSAMLEL